MPEEAYKYLDKISVSTYPSKPLGVDLLNEVKKMCRKHDVSIECCRPHHHFGYNVIGKEIKDSKLVHKIFMTCSLAWKQHCHTLFDNKISRCSRLPFMNLKLADAGCVKTHFIEEDCLKIVDKDDFSEKLKQYLEAETPLLSCNFCLGSVGKRIKHKQLTQKEIVDSSWAKLDHKGLIDWITLYRKVFKRTFLKRV